MSIDRPSRRRALTIIAATAACTLGGRIAEAQSHDWRGIALGADARLVLVGRGRHEAEQALSLCRAEVARLESIFSLHEPQSEIRRLNRASVLDPPSLDMIALLRQAEAMHAASEGLFDPTVQPLWAHYAALASPAEADRNANRTKVASLLSRVGMRSVEIAPERVGLRQGTEITLNGIAQGYITDSIAQLLRRLGWGRVLVDMGEVSVPGDDPFDIEIPELKLRLPLASAALATSSGALSFPGAPEVGHILSPVSGTTPCLWSAVTVRHRSATIADGLSTALFLAAPVQFDRILGRFPGARAWRTTPIGATEAI